ncbi:hypothetical protein, partial [Phocaeicola coprocola]
KYALKMVLVKGEWFDLYEKSFGFHAISARFASVKMTILFSDRFVSITAFLYNGSIMKGRQCSW